MVQNNLMDKQSEMDLNTFTNGGNIFDKYVGRESLFEDKKVLSSNFIPDNIVHRHEQIDDLTSILAPALQDHQPNNIFVYGKTGTGKTVSIQYILEQLKERTDDNVMTIYINCKMKKVADTEYRLFAQLLREFNEYVPDTGLPTDSLYKKFFRRVDAKQKVIILALDEIDALVKKVGDDFLYNLTRINSELEKSSLALIGISNDLSFCNNLDARVKSSLGEEEILFRPYNAVQLKDILERRVEAAFEDGVVTEGVINKCAAIAAQEHGDARKALDLLKVASELAERKGEKKVTEKFVDKAEGKINLDRVLEAIKAQPLQSQLVLRAIIDGTSGNEPKISTGEVFEKYKKLCKDLGHKELTQRRVSDLISELEMMGIISSKIVSHGRYGRSRSISLALSDSVKEKAISLLEERFE